MKLYHSWMQWNYSFACRNSIIKKMKYVCLHRPWQNQHKNNNQTSHSEDERPNQGHHTFRPFFHQWYNVLAYGQGQRHGIQTLTVSTSTWASDFNYTILLLVAVFWAPWREKNAHATKQHLQHLKFYAPGYHSVKLEQIILEIWLNTPLCRQLNP